MPIAISPGVYSRIYQLESYVQEVPSSTAFVAFFSDKGVDNKLQFIASEEQLLKQFGKPNIVKYTKQFGQGLYIADQIALHSPSMYVIRCLPEDATFANLAFWLLKRPNIIIQGTSPVTDIRFGFEGDISGLESLNDQSEILDKFSARSYDKVPALYIEDTSSGSPPTTAVRLVITDDGGTVGVDLSDTKPLIQSNPDDPPPPPPVYVQYNNHAYRVTWDGSAIQLVDEGALQTGDNIPKFYLKRFVTTNANPELNNRWNFFSLITTDGTSLSSQNETLTYEADAWEFVKPLFIIETKWRGDYGNNYKFEFIPSANMDNVYELVVYEKTNDGDWAVKSSYAISFDPNMLDDVGESNFIKHVVDTYDSDLQVYIDEEQIDSVKEEVLDLLTITEYDGTRKTAGVVDCNDCLDYSLIPDNASLPTDPVDLTEGYYFIKDRAGGDIFGYDGYLLYYDAANREWIKDTTDPNRHPIGPLDYDTIIYSRKQDKYFTHVGSGRIFDFNPYELFLLSPPPTDRQLQMGSDGELFTSTGIDASVAEKLLIQAYQGLIDKDIINRDWIWIDLVYDCGYPKDVKDAIVTLASEIRRDCVAIVDNGDNLTAEKAIEARIKFNRWNTMYAAIYEPYIKIKDKFTSKDLWMTPIYEVCKLIALNDRINEVWYAVAGYTRGAIQDLKDLRYAPLLGERDQFYLNQINPIARFKDGDVLWGQLTSQRQPGPLQDLNIVRCVLYIDRALRQYYKYNLFDMDDYITWATLEDQTIAFLTDVKNRRGLYSFDVTVYADEYMIKRKMCQVNVILFPTRVLERIMLNIGVK